MAVPKKRTSSSKRDMRRSHHALVASYAYDCPNCGELKQRHRACPSCGFFKKDIFVRSIATKLAAKTAASNPESPTVA
jgi:large subunit ribosomal protein L32